MSLFTGINLNLLLSVIAEIETGGKPRVIGDQGAAYGLYQIHKEVVEDVNRVFHQHYTHEDCFNPSIAKRIATMYLQYWGAIYQQKTHQPVTYEVLARIWNGGPQGWKHESTANYWLRAKEKIEGVDGSALGDKNKQALDKMAALLRGKKS